MLAASIALARLYCCDGKRQECVRDFPVQEPQASRLHKECGTYNDVAPEDGIVGHLVQPGDQVWQGDS